MEGTRNTPFHIALIPWLAYGHFLPFLDLSMRLSHRGLKVTLISTLTNVTSMEKLLNDPDSNAIEFQTIELAKVEGLPEGKENTRDLEGHQVRFLIEAVEKSKESLQDLLSHISADSVVCDLFIPTNFNLGIPVVVYMGFPAVSVCLSWEENPELSKFPFSPIYESRFTERSVQGFRMMRPIFHGYAKVCSAVIINSCREVEGKFIDHLKEELIGKPVFAVGPLSLTTKTEAGNESEDVSECMAWMDKQPKCSVLYIGFGSQCCLSKEETKEIALGLEESGVLFVWALRKFDDGNERNKLPDGFEERIKEKKRGFVLGGWVPQKKLLQKDCVGGFMTHCGWSSLMEAMQVAVAFVAVPLMYDQGANAQFVSADLGLGLEVRRDAEGNIRSEEVCRCVKGVISGVFKSKAEEIRDVFDAEILPPCHGSQDCNMDEFVNFLHALPENSPKSLEEKSYYFSILSTKRKKAALKE